MTNTVRKEEIRKRYDETFPGKEVVTLRQATKFIDPKKETRWLRAKRDFPRFVENGKEYVRKERLIEWLAQ